MHLSALRIAVPLGILLALLTAACDREVAPPDAARSRATQTRELPGAAAARRAREIRRDVRELAPEPRTETSTATNLDVFAVELAAARACDRLRDQFRALRASDRDAATGTIWIRGCESSADGQKAAFSIAGDAWQESKNGEQDVVSFSLRVTGALAVGYEPADKLVEIRFTPGAPAAYSVLPRRSEDPPDVHVETAILGAIATGLAAPSSAPQLAPPDVDPRDGFRVEIPACNAVPRFLFEPYVITGGSGDPDIAVRLPPGVPAIFGPHDPANLTITVYAVAVPVTASLLCMEDAHAIANAFLGAYTPRAVTPLATGTVTRRLELSAGGAHCPVALVLQNRSDLPATAYWSRDVASQEAASEAGPLRCTPVAPKPRAGPVQ